MPIGDYRHEVTLDTTDGAGGVKPLDPPTWYCAQVAEGGGLVTLVGPYRPDLTTATRVHFQSRTFHVDSVLNRGARDVEISLTCKEVFE